MQSRLSRPFLVCRASQSSLDKRHNSRWLRCRHPHPRAPLLQRGETRIAPSPSTNTWWQVCLSPLLLSAKATYETCPLTLLKQRSASLYDKLGSLRKGPGLQAPHGCGLRWSRRYAQWTGSALWTWRSIPGWRDERVQRWRGASPLLSARLCSMLRCCSRLCAPSSLSGRIIWPHVAVPYALAG